MLLTESSYLPQNIGVVVSLVFFIYVLVSTIFILYVYESLLYSVNYNVCPPLCSYQFHFSQFWFAILPAICH